MIKGKKIDSPIQAVRIKSETEKERSSVKNWNVN